MKREYGDYIQDIIDSIKEAGEFTKELSFDDFKQDKKTVNAVIRSLEIIWKVVKEELPPVKPNILKMLKEFEHKKGNAK